MPNTLLFMGNRGKFEPEKLIFSCISYHLLILSPRTNTYVIKVTFRIYENE